MRTKKRFEGKTAIVTGGSRGIGLGIAQRLVAEGARVVLTGRNENALEEAVSALGGPSCALGVVGRADDVEHQCRSVSSAIEQFGSADLLVNNAGINPTYGPMIDVELGAARKTVEVNVIAALAWTQQVYRAWMRDHGGSVVNISSISGLKPAPGIGLYGATKAMLISITELLAVELGPGIRVNAVAPGVVKTRFAAALYDGKEEEVAAPYPLRRLGEPDDIADVVTFLLSDEAGWMTGQTLVADGGVTLTSGA
ncbi:3-ketoacyl-ACP reductase [Microbacterium mangrovi]|uniref:3-ketoacyl-ACP reductase n=1 Tax=Microbacterium mangrovi TaxID=1348253 RepID=A0A0B2A5R4_9MICO|nr:SDR family oxidoreductase [Microbacterium mangrovi]KHK98814.1 3-ketoacyl-ACP reductase [Microbacterium mangrovi]